MGTGSRGEALAQEPWKTSLLVASSQQHLLPQIQPWREPTLGKGKGAGLGL